jgi:hypothetical protein
MRRRPAVAHPQRPHPQFTTDSDEAAAQRGVFRAGHHRRQSSYISYQLMYHSQSVNSRRLPNLAEIPYE